MRLLVGALVALPVLASADPIPAPVTAAGAPADLRVKQLPVQLKMPARPKPARSAKPAKPAKQVAQTADPAAVAEPESSLKSFTPFPTSRRDLAERVTFKLRAGVELDGAAASGESLRGGAALPDQFAEQRSWIVGDAVIGTRDMLLPSLGAYFLTSFQLDATDSFATRTAFVRPYDNDDANSLAIKAGYAEWGRDDRRPDQKLWLRGGRQFRLDGGALFAYFDGGTIGYRTKGIEASAFGGQRVTLYVDTPRGILFGATAAVDLETLRDIPVKISADYMGLAIDGLGVNDEVASQTRQLLALAGQYELSKKTRIDVRARLVNSGRDDDGDLASDGFALGRVGARFRTQSAKLVAIVDLEHRDGGDLAYDLAAPSAVDVVSVARQLGVGLAAPVSATSIAAQLDYRRKDTELLVFARAERPDAADEVRTVDQRGWYEGGLAIAGSPLGNRVGGVYATAQYKLRQYADYASCSVRENVGCMDGSDRNDQAFSQFGDTSSSGLDRLHEVAVDATLRSGGRGARWRFALGAFYRVYDFGSPYIEITDEGRGGGRADLQWWFTRDLRVDVAAELAEASPVLARELGLMSSVRAALEARW
ncbi:MAG: hypothetical protein H0T89_16500 [Deltaproteobacteria bacterium]|nr:hypothetical protein [Deltaproteobacteria bacterium]MDQ3299437.1 alanine and proline-rich secreted protein Apa [Myxococcota bacterium]